jgi:DnaK suppressor protein
MRNVSVTQVVERQDLRDQVDQSAVEMRHDLDLALLEMRSETLARIDDALAQLAEGRYGSCNQCGRDIAVARLAAMPFATRCRVCEQAREEKRVRELAGKRRDERIYGRAEGAVFRP